MKILDVLKETPLPDDWDKDVYKKGNKGGFKQRIEYAKQKAQRVGGGSSRVAFVIDYQGRKTVLKIAKNQKGLAQNEQEVSMLRTAEILGADGIVTVPMIDYDEQNSKPSWIHVEYARKLKSPQEFERLTGFDMEQLIMYAANVSHNRSLPRAHNMEFDRQWTEKVWEDEESFSNEFVSFVGNTELHLPDLLRANNWGVFNNHPVIIDLGLSDDIYTAHYS